MATRHELHDHQWKRIKPLLPTPKAGGRRFKNARQYINGMLWFLRTGAPWRDLPSKYGQWRAVHTRFSCWRKDGVWDRIIEALQEELHQAGLIDAELWCIDGSNIRAHRVASGARKKGAQKKSRRIMPLDVHEEVTAPKFI